MRQKTALGLGDAKKIIAAAEHEATANGWNVVIAVVDEGGHLLMLARLDGAQLGSVEVSIAKARSAALFRRPTEFWEARIAEGRQGYLVLPGALPLEGGVPVIVNGEVVGAVGVSGVSSGDDARIARAGVAALGG